MPTGELSVTLTASTLSSHTEQSGNIVYSVLGDASLASNALVLPYGSLRATLDAVAISAAAAIENIAKLDITLDGIRTETFSAVFGGTESPYEDVLSWTGHPLTGSLVRVRTGNLFGMFGEPGEFGLYAGDGWDASSDEPPSSSSQYIRLGSFTNEFHNVPVNLYDSGVLTMQMEPDAPSFAMGNPLPSAYDTGIGLWQGRDSDDIYKWRIGDPSGANLSWNGTSLSINNGSLDIGGASAHLAFGNPPPTSPTSGTGIWIDRTGFYGVNAGVAQIFIDTLDGILYVDGGTEFGVNPLLGDLYVDGILTLGTDGRLQQGTGTWGVDFTGSAIWNDSGVMNIGGWNNNVKQWWGGSDGKFYTGGGRVTMDADGIAINSTSSYLDPNASMTFKYSGQTYYTISGENGFVAYNVLSIPFGSTDAPSYRTWVLNENPNAEYYLLVSEGNSTYKYGSSKLEIDLNTSSKSLDLLMKAYDYATVSRAQGRLYYYSNLGQGYNTVTLSSECQDPTEGTKTASILLRTASYYAEVSSRIDITTDDVNIISNLAITGITTTTGGVHVGGTSDPGTDNLVVDGTIKDGSGVEYLKTTGKAADSDKLDNIDSSGFVQTSGSQTIAGVKTFSSIPVLPSSDPTTANQAVRKGFADATYLGITAKAADADKLDGNDSTYFANATDIPSSATSYTATLVGWSGTPTQRMKYVKIGKLMVLTIYISGTSDTTTATATLPSGITAMALGYAQYAPMRVTNAGSMPGSWGMASLSSGGSTINFYVNQGGGGWTNSGTKTIEGTFVFLTA